MKFNTKLLHGKAGRNTPDGATLPGISQVSAFSYDSAEHLEKVFGNKSPGFAYTRIGITVALVFIGIPFVVRTVQPVLEKLDPSYEEAAGVLGASRTKIFWSVVFPEIRPAVITGFGLAFGRCLGEYGSVVFIAGNQPFQTEITPLIIMSELQEYDYASATAIALVMLIVAFLILFLSNWVQARSSKKLKGGS